MKNTKLWLGILAIALVFGMALVGCDSDAGTKEVPVTSVALNKNSLSLAVGGTETLTATVSPSDATDKTVTWSTSSSAVATVENGKVTAVAAGTATITVKTNDGGKTDTCAVTVSVGGLLAPAGFTVTASGTTINASWTAVTGASGYTLYASADNFTTSASVDCKTTTSYSESDCPWGTYYFKIAAYNASGQEGAMSSVVSVTVGGGIPAAPTGLIAIAYSPSGIALTWNAVPGATGYKVYNGTTSSVSYVGSVDSNYAYNIDLPANTTVYYKVSAFNASDESALSNLASAKTLAEGNYSLDGIWTRSDGRRITVNGKVGITSAFGTTNAIGQDAINKGYWTLGDQYWKDITYTNNLTWSGQASGVSYNTSNPNVATGSAWTNATFTLSANGQTLTVTGTWSGSGPFTETYTRGSYSLDGIWERTDDGMRITISGNSGVISAYGSTAYILDAANKGFIQIGSQKFRNINSTDTLKWTGMELLFYIPSNNPNVCEYTLWSSTTITLSADGQTLSTYTPGSSDPSATWKRKQ